MSTSAKGSRRSATKNSTVEPTLSTPRGTFAFHEASVGQPAPVRQTAASATGIAKRKHIATTSMTGRPCGSDFTIASTVVNSRMPPVATANGTAGRAWSVAETGCITANSAGFLPSSTRRASACDARRADGYGAVNPSPATRRKSLRPQLDVC